MGNICAKNKKDEVKEKPAEEVGENSSSHISSSNPTSSPKIQPPE